MFEELLIRLAEGLDKRGLPYMIIGGQAVLLYGEPRLTRDIDITLGLDIDRFDEIISLSQDLGLNPLPQDPLKFAGETMVLPTQEKTTGIRVDFIFSFTPYESQAIRRARKIFLRHQAVCFASPEDVVIHKIVAGRPEIWRMFGPSSSKILKSIRNIYATGLDNYPPPWKVRTYWPPFLI